MRAKNQSITIKTCFIFALKIVETFHKHIGRNLELKIFKKNIKKDRFEDVVVPKFTDVALQELNNLSCTQCLLIILTAMSEKNHEDTDYYLKQCIPAGVGVPCCPGKHSTSGISSYRSVLPSNTTRNKALYVMKV